MRTDFASLTSAYYPPRARWYSRLLRWGQRGVDRLGLDLETQGLGQALARLLVDVVVPGWAFVGQTRREVAPAVAAGWGLGLLLFIVLLGWPLANLGFALAVSLHAISAGCGFAKHFVRRALGLRMALGVVLGAGFAGLVYLPAVAWFNAHVAMPLSTAQGVVIVNPRVPPESIRRGDWMAYRLRAARLRGPVVLHDGYGLGRVLAAGGDEVTFAPGEFRINQTLMPVRQWMPASGGLTLTPGTWFIWPDLKIARNGIADEAVCQVLFDLAVVSPSQYCGRPYNWWFFRRPKP